ncbi:glycosyltransferase family protein [Arthrobacter zhaoxinii]|uniref:hypothetical protein n=1 Tax=Arthrobacter zhaoxinii TaxID=2964616 RepID=UPI0021046422|nr:hypothetical protein [Arthrobacter zhaoxinii]MCQ2001777.1 hypothetical protein [Arthrobacter zhaoxinii]
MFTNSLVTVATYGRAGGSARVRIYDWLDFLRVDAAVFDYAGMGDNGVSTILRNAPSALRAEVELRALPTRLSKSVLLMSREASPFSSGKLEERLLKSAALSVYDFDDAIYAASARFPQSIWPKDRIWTRAVRHADRVIAGNEYLAEAASKIADDVTIIPSCVNPDAYPIKTDYGLNGTPTLVWLGSPSTEQFLLPLADALVNVNRVRPIRLRVISAGQQSLGKLDAIVERVNWSEDTFANELPSADLGIMPLLDTPFARGKCAYKLLQYGAAGLPVMGSPVGTNLSVLAAMGGAAPSTPAQWENALHDFLDTSEEERRRMGERAYATVGERYSFQAWQDEWRRVVGIDDSGLLSDAGSIS